MMNLESTQPQLNKQRHHRASSLASAASTARKATKFRVADASEVYLSYTKTKKVDFYSFDADYLRRLHARDHATECHFASYFGERLKAKLCNRGFAPATREDITQDTFLRVLKAVRENKVEHPERLGAYVSSVCDNVILEKFREHSRNQHLDVDALDIPDGKPTLESLILRKEKSKLVDEILSKLTPKKRNILRALIFEQLDRDELCSRFNVNGDYLRVLLFRAKEDFTALSKERGIDWK